MPKTNKTELNPPAPVATPAPLPTNRKPTSDPSGWSPLALDSPLLPAPVEQAVTEPAKAPRKRKGRTLKQIVETHKRPDGKVGFTFRDLCPALHVAGESLRAAIINPGRLSVSSVVALAELMGEEPLLVLSDILAEIRSKPHIKKMAEEKARSGKAK